MPNVLVPGLISLEDDYNRDFMQAAHILYMSDERLPDAPEAWAAEVMTRYGPEVLVIGMGDRGALLCIRCAGTMQHIPAVHTRPVRNTIGAGDALFSSFCHVYLRIGNPYAAVRKAVVFASYKIGALSAADGFLDADALDQLYAENKVAL